MMEKASANGQTDSEDNENGPEGELGNEYTERPPAMRKNAVVIEKTDETCNPVRPKVATRRAASMVKVETASQIITRMQIPISTISHPLLESKASSPALVRLILIPVALSSDVAARRMFRDFD